MRIIVSEDLPGAHLLKGIDEFETNPRIGMFETYVIDDENGIAFKFTTTEDGFDVERIKDGNVR